MSDSTVRVGFVSTAVTTGLNALRGQFSSFRNDVNGEFDVGKFLAVGAVLAGFNALLDKAGQLADMSARFGVGAEGLQRIGNAAEQDGVSMGGVASAMNKAIIAQQKLRDGSKEVAKAMTDLGINAADFINLDPEEAFYAIADGVAASDDPMKAYNATVALLGKSAGELIPTLQKGSEEIKAVGNAAGVMSEDTVALLDDVGDKFGVMMNTLKIWGGETFSFLHKSVETFGASLAGIWVKTQHLFGAISSAERDAMMEGVQSEMDRIWGRNQPEEEEKPKKKFDIEDIEAQGKAAEDLQKLYDKIADQKRAQALEQMAATSRINELVREQADLYTKAATEQDKIKQAEMWVKAGDLQKDITAEREKVAKEEDARMDRLNKKREAYEKKKADAELVGKTDLEKLDILSRRRLDLDRVLAKEKDPEKIYDLLSERMDLNKDINSLKPKNEQEVQASSLAKIGGGGGAFLASKSDAMDRTAKASEKSAQNAEHALKELRQIKDKLSEGARWNP